MNKHTFWPNRKGECQKLIGGIPCGRSETDSVHGRMGGQARLCVTKEQVQNLMMRMGGTYQQAVEALNDELGIEVSE